eukprot:scaffold15216_cov41-Attheya_sp.AAC.3
MDEAFNGLNTFDDPLCWDVSSVTTMIRMFKTASAFNQDITAWDVSSVTTMYMMFESASAFNQNLSAWDVSSITTMANMFRLASVFNQNLCAWASKSPQLGNVNSMFQGASSCQNSSTPRLWTGKWINSSRGGFQMGIPIQQCTNIGDLMLAPLYSKSPEPESHGIWDGQIEGFWSQHKH